MNRFLFTANEPAELRLVKRYDNGGGEIEIPVLRVATIDLAQTATRSKESVAMGLKQFKQMIGNLAKWPGPIPINVQPHKKFSETGGAAPGFLEALFIESDALWARLSLSPPLFYEVYELGVWRGFSVDVALDPEMPTVKFSGWVVTHGVFTNRPAADVNFKVATTGVAAEVISSAQQGTIALSLGQVPGDGRSNMDWEKEAKKLEAQVAAKDTLIAEMITSKDATLEAHQTKVHDLESGIALTQKEITDLKTKVIQMESEKGTQSALAVQLNATIKQRDEEKVALETERDKAVKKAADMRDTEVGAKVVSLAKKAIKGGAAASIFDGVEDEPVDWLKSKGMSLEGLELMVETLSLSTRDDLKTGTKSKGTVPKNDDDDDATALQLSAVEKKQLQKAVGKDRARFAGVKTPEDLDELTANDKK